MNKKEKEIYFAAFEKAQGKSYDQRKAAADAAVKAHRAGPAKPAKKTIAQRRIATINEAVDKGIDEGNKANKVKGKKQ